MLAYWSIEQLAILVLAAFVASAVISIVILTVRPWLYLYAAAAGLAGGAVMRMTPGGRLVAEQSGAWVGWLGQPVLGLLFALVLALALEILLHPGVPVLGRVRPYGRRALRPWRWGSALEISERAGVPAWVPDMLGVSVEYRPLAPAQVMARIRSLSTVLCATSFSVFVAVPEFRGALWDSLKPETIFVNLLASAFVTFLLEPLQHELAHAETGGDTPEASTVSQRIVSIVGTFAVAAGLFVLLEAVQIAIETQIETLSIYHWIMLLEVCALPLLVTTFFFGATLHRSELGERRWDRALEASIFGGAIIVAPFTVLYFLTQTFPPSSWQEWGDAVARTDNLYRLAVLIGIMGLSAVLLGIAAAALVSAATYGIYAAALGVALSDARPSAVRRQVAIALLLAGALVQGLIALAAWWLDAGVPLLDYLPFVLSIGWAVGLYLSRFHVDFPEPAKLAPAAAP